MDAVNTNAKIFYMNGITTSLKSAQGIHQQLAEITGAEVELVHNNTTSSSDVALMVTKLVVGFFCLYYSTREKVKSTTQRFLLQAGAMALIGWTLKDYVDIEDRINIKAGRLAKKVAHYLKESPNAKAVLVLHSQGAEIGRRALRFLKKYKGRISVATVGGMVNIAKHQAKRVINFHDDGDLVSRFAKTFFGGDLLGVASPSSKIVLSASCGGGPCHSMDAYLEDRTLRRQLKQLTAA